MSFKFTKALALLALSGMLFSCGGEDLDDLGTPEFRSRDLAAEITDADLIGEWKMYSMVGDQEVNFNGDEISSKDLLSETTCFNDMYFRFEENGEVHTKQAKLYFDNQGDFTCSSGEYQAFYAINGDILTVNFSLNGVPLAEKRQISLKSNGSGEFLQMSLTKVEAAAYVDDPGTTNVSHLEHIEIVFKKM